MLESGAWSCETVEGEPCDPTAVVRLSGSPTRDERAPAPGLFPVAAGIGRVEFTRVPVERAPAEAVSAPAVAPAPRAFAFAPSATIGPAAAREIIARTNSAGIEAPTG